MYDARVCSSDSGRGRCQPPVGGSGAMRGDIWQYFSMFYISGTYRDQLARFGEFCICCCSPLLPQLACSIPKPWPKPFSRALYCKLWKELLSCTYHFLTSNIGRRPSGCAMVGCRVEEGHLNRGIGHCSPVSPD